MICNLRITVNGLNIKGYYELNNTNYIAELQLQTGHDLVKKTPIEIILNEIKKEHNL